MIDAVKEKLRDRDFEALMQRAQGLTLEEMGEQIGLTRERARQLAKRAVESGSVYTSVARGFLEPVIAELKREGVLSLVRAATLLKCKESSTIRLMAIIADYEYEIDDEAISLFDGNERLAFESLLRHQLKKGELPQENGNIVLRKLLADAPKKLVKPIELLVNAGTESLSIVAACRLIGKKWLSGYIGSQLVAAGVNGLFFDEIDTGGSFDSATELKEFLEDTADVLNDGRFRRANDVYRKGDEILRFLKASNEPLATSRLMEMSSQKWHQPTITGNYLSPLYEAILIGRGLYVHAENLNLSVRDVKRIAHWGAELLHGEKTSVSAEVLLELFQESDLGLSVETPYQLVSIIAKHPDVKRLSNNLQLAHKDFFDDSELYLAASDPDLAAQWHPEKNGTTKPENVRPTTTTVYWWRCEKGHEFQASAVYRTRNIRSCPGCQERWNLAKIRHFVSSLRDHLETLTPAELYVIFQQSGLWQKGGNARGFVKALATGRFPKKELERFVDGEPSLVDDFVSDGDFDLADAVLDDELDSTSSDTVSSNSEEAGHDKEPDLPKVRAKHALDALDCQVLASTDSEAAEFLVASAKAKIWSHAYRDSASAVAEAESRGESQYSRKVADSFLHEFWEATALDIPDGYSFSIDGEICEPNLMQRHVAIQVRDRLRYGNWSGTGAGKTLSAILATRVVNSALTIVCCPNAVVGQTTDGWATEIKRVYPDSEVAVKTLQPQWSSNSHRYLVLNYEQFQQPNSEPDLKQFLDENSVDFIVIDEVHYAKQRFADQMSKRKRLILALVAGAAEANPELRVLGLSATPVINNLQ